MMRAPHYGDIKPSTLRRVRASVYRYSSCLEQVPTLYSRLHNAHLISSIASRRLERLVRSLSAAGLLSLLS
jgi:hypothetical protein